MWECRIVITLLLAQQIQCPWVEQLLFVHKLWGRCLKKEFLF